MDNILLTLNTGGKYDTTLTFKITKRMTPTVKSIIKKAMVYFEEESGKMDREVFIKNFLKSIDYWKASNYSDAYRILGAVQLVESVFEKQWDAFRFYAEKHDIDGLMEAVTNGAETPLQMLLLESGNFCNKVCELVNQLPRRIFVDDIDCCIMKAIILGNVSKYKLVSNSLAAALFGNLAELGLIPFQWAKKIGDNEVLVSSHSNKILTARDLTSAWSRVRSSNKKEYSFLKENLRKLYDKWKNK